MKNHFVFVAEGWPLLNNPPTYMWLNLNSEMQYRFEGDISPAAFFDHLSLLLAPTDTLVLGCYDARADIRRYLAAASIPQAWDHLQPTETWEINRAEHPTGAAFHLRAEPRILRQLADCAQSVSQHIDLCDHLAAYSVEHPLLIYHGTFWEPLFVSARLPRNKVDAFSKAIGVPFEVINFYEVYCPTTTGN